MKPIFIFDTSALLEDSSMIERLSLLVCDYDILIPASTIEDLDRFSRYKNDIAQESRVVMQKIFHAKELVIKKDYLNFKNIEDLAMFMYFQEKKQICVITNDNSLIIKLAMMNIPVSQEFKVS
jgi:predicted ribonuclease YlaK